MPKSSQKESNATRKARMVWKEIEKPFYAFIIYNRDQFMKRSNPRDESNTKMESKSGYKLSNFYPKFQEYMFRHAPHINISTSQLANHVNKQANNEVMRFIIEQKANKRFPPDLPASQYYPITGKSEIPSELEEQLLFKYLETPFIAFAEKFKPVKKDLEMPFLFVGTDEKWFGVAKLVLARTRVVISYFTNVINRIRQVKEPVLIKEEAISRVDDDCTMLQFSGNLSSSLSDQPNDFSLDSLTSEEDHSLGKRTQFLDESDDYFHKKEAASQSLLEEIRDLTDSSGQWFIPVDGKPDKIEKISTKFCNLQTYHDVLHCTKAMLYMFQEALRQLEELAMTSKLRLSRGYSILKDLCSAMAGDSDLETNDSSPRDRLRHNPRALEEFNERPGNSNARLNSNLF